MDTIYNSTEKIQQLSQELLTNTRLLQKYQDKCDFDRFVSTTKKGARITSNMFLLYYDGIFNLSNGKIHCDVRRIKS